MEDQGKLSKPGRPSFPVLSWADVAHGPVDGDGPGVKAPHHLAHLLSVVEGVIAPHLGNALLEETTATLSVRKNPSLLPEERKPKTTLPLRRRSPPLPLMGSSSVESEEALVRRHQHVISQDVFSFSVLNDHSFSPTLSLMHTWRHTPSSGSGSSRRSCSGAPPPAGDFWAERSGTTGKQRHSDPGPSWCSSCTGSAQTVAGTKKERT